MPSSRTSPNDGPGRGYSMNATASTLPDEAVSAALLSSSPFHVLPTCTTTVTSLASPSLPLPPLHPSSPPLPSIPSLTASTGRSYPASLCKSRSSIVSYLSAHSLTPGNNYNSHNFLSNNGSSIMLMTTQQGQVQENLQRLQVQENQHLQTSSLYFQLHQQPLPTMHPQLPQQQQQRHHHQHHLQQLQPQQRTLRDADMSQQAQNLAQRQRNPLQQRILQQPQHQGLPLPLSMSFSHDQQRQEQQQQLQQQVQLHDGSQQKRGRFFSWSASTTPLTPLSAGPGSLPVMGMDRLGQVVYVDSQQYQNQAGHHLQQQPQHSHQHHTQAPTKQQSQHPWISTTTIQSITPDQFLGSGFDWITGMSDLGTPSSSKATHSRGTNGSGATPPTSNVSTLDSTQSCSNGVNGLHELLDAILATSSTTAGAKVSPQSFSAMGLTGLELTTLASGSCNTSGRQDPMASTFDLKSAHNEPTADSTGGEARQQRSKDQRDSNFTLSVSAAMPPVIRKTQELTGSSPQPAQPPTPLSPMAAFPDSQSAEHTFQRTNITMKQETSNMERISATPGSTLPRSLSTSAPTQEIASSTSWYDMVPMPSPTKPTAAPPHHHKVLSATSQDSRVTGSGGIWGGHHAINISSPMPKSTVHARRSSNNSSGSTSHIISSLSIQSAPRREAFVADPDVPASNTDTDSVTGLQRTTSVSSKGTTPDIDATADPLAAMNLTTRSASDPNEAALTASIGEEDGSDNENGRPARCPHCNKEFQSKGLLRSHVVSHSSDRPFVCWDCTDKSYKRNHDLLRHRREKHNIDGAIVPSRGSSRSHNGMSRDGTSDRSSKPPTLASQPQFAHQDLMYGPNSGVMYLGNTGPPLSDLSSPSSGSPLDPYNGVSYGQHQHGSSFYPSHPRNRPGLGLGLGLDNFGMKEFPTGLSLVASSGGAGGRSFDSGRRSSRGNFMGASIAGASANGRKRKFSNSNSTTPALIPPTAMAIMPPPAPAASGYTVSAVPSVSQPYNQLQHAGISNAFGNINAHTDQMGGLP